MSEFSEKFGEIPEESEFKKRVRIHQGWWRMNVLNEKPGEYPRNHDKRLCSTILNGEGTKKNFLTNNVRQALEAILNQRKVEGKGMMERSRLFNNLLSSQPLCFNFFGELMFDRGLALKILKNWWSDLTEVIKVIFEYAPIENYTNDNSAFDVAFEVMEGDKKGLIGMECKYTDTFSATVYDKPAYRDIFKSSTSFTGSYDSLISGNFNQLFRNQLIAESLIQNKKFDFVRTGLFCYEKDQNAIEIAHKFRQLLQSHETFQVITYQDFIEKVQKLDLTWEQREWTMLLWARYCGIELSKEFFNYII
jgi:hypothetical protein